VMALPCDPSWPLLPHIRALDDPRLPLWSW
jgi:hypothetical protein